MKIGKRAALIVVDVQNDFCPGGTLPVPEGDRVVPVLNEYIRTFSSLGMPVYFTRDWHPSKHISFKPQGGIWPEHCVQGTKGSNFHPALSILDDAPIISKGTELMEDAYSGFQGTDLAERLKRQGIRRLFIGGLATDYCVKNAVLDALSNGFETVYLEDASRGVEVAPGDTSKAIAQMLEAGAYSISIKDLKVE